MLTQLALLPMLAVTVTGVTSETQDSDVIIEVATSEPVPASVVRPMAGHRLLYLFVDNASPEREVFENGEHPVVARTRTRYTKLEVPLDPGVRCQEPAAVETLPSGLRVQFSCGSNAAAAVAGQGRPPGEGRRTPRPPGRSASQELLAVALALPEEMPFADKTETEEDETQTGKPLPADGPSTEPVAPPAQEIKAAAPAAAGPAPRPAETANPLRPDAQAAGLALVTTAPAAAPTAAPRPVAAATAAATAASAVPAKAASGPVVPAHSASTPVVAVAGGGHSGSSLVLAVVLLVGVAGGVLALTRRRARRQGLIQILETAAIGPKRALLVARVNGQTMVLGASEAGIALLASLEGKIDPPVATVMGNLPVVREQPDELAPALPDAAAAEPEGEMGVLRRLFQRRPKDSSARDADAFRELLDESYEDQELRNKLAMGLSGKVS